MNTLESCNRETLKINKRKTVILNFYDRNKKIMRIHSEI